jgi:hypothetical protein
LAKTLPLLRSSASAVLKGRLSSSLGSRYAFLIVLKKVPRQRSMFM